MSRLIAWALSMLFLAGPAPLLAADEAEKGKSATGSAAQEENANKQGSEGATKGQERAAERRHQGEEKESKKAKKSKKKNWKQGKKAGKDAEESAREWKGKGAKQTPTPEVTELPTTP